MRCPKVFKNTLNFFRRSWCQSVENPGIQISEQIGNPVHGIVGRQGEPDFAQKMPDMFSGKRVFLSLFADHPAGTDRDLVIGVPVENPLKLIEQVTPLHRQGSLCFRCIQLNGQPVPDQLFNHCHRQVIILHQAVHGLFEGLGRINGKGFPDMRIAAGSRHHQERIH